MIRELKPARWVATEGEGESKKDKYVIEVAIDNVTELEKLKDNTAHGSVAELIDTNGLTVYMFDEPNSTWREV